jgi:peptide/nickel transport system substrate-binding protein
MRFLVQHSTVLLVAVAAGVGLALPAQAQQFQCPKRGGDLVFAQEAKVNSLDMHASTTISTRNVMMNIYETLLTRDETNNTIPELAESFTESPDKLTYTFRVRRGIKFHNGKELTSADVAASFDRFKRVAVERGLLGNVEGWETPDPHSFVLKMRVVQPTFPDELSSFNNPLVIIPAEHIGAEALRLPPVGTGPFQFVEFIPDSHVKIRRYDGYQPNTNFRERTGFGGYKQACLDSVTFRIVTEAGARVAGLEAGDFHVIEDMPAKSMARLKDNKAIELKPLEGWWIHIAHPNVGKPPTDNLAFRRAVQAALDMREIMDAATDGAFSLDYGFQAKNRAVYSELGKELFNVNDPKKAREFLAQSSYRGEEIVLLTNKDYTSMYNAALVMSEQLKAIGIKVRLDVTDWPTSVQKREKEADTWNYFFNGWGTNTALGPSSVFRQMAAPSNFYMAVGLADKFPDKVDRPFNEAYTDMLTRPTLEERKAAFARAQHRLMDQALVLPFGWLHKIQATRVNVKNFVPFRIPRFSNVSIEG